MGRNVIQFKDKDNNVYDVKDVVARTTKADVIINNTESAPITSVKDAMGDMPVKTLEVQIDPVQDTHGLDPYPAGGGKNKLDNDAFKTFANWDAGLVSVGTYSTSVTYKGYDITSLLTVGTQYTISFAFPSTGLPVYCALCSSDGTTSSRLKAFTDGSSVVNTNHTFTPESGITYYIRSGTCTTESDFNSTVKNIVSVQLELGSTATDYAPFENICQISGWTSADVTRTGKNLLDPNLTYASGYWGTDGEVVSSNNYIHELEFIKVKPDTDYAFQMNKTASSSRIISICEYDDEKVFNGYTIVIPSTAASTGIVSGTVQTKSNTKYIRINVPAANVNNIQFEEGSTASAYEAYQVKTYTYTFPQSAGTVYGGTLTIHQDGTGTLVVDRFTHIYDGTDGFYMTSTSTENAFARHTASDFPLFDSNKTDEQISSHLPYSQITTGNTGIGFRVYHDTTWVQFRLPGMSTWTDTDLTNWLTAQYNAGTPFTVSYPIATPVTYQLTNQQVVSLLKGQNVLWSTTGNTAIEYAADTKLYIDGKIAELQALILES